MTCQPATISNDLYTLPRLPGWVTSGRTETLETVTFRSGTALTVLDQLIGDQRYAVPIKLLVNRLALKAALATSKQEGRLAREADIRDAFHLTPPVRPEAQMAICWPSGAMEGGFVRKGHGRSAIWLEWSTRAR